MRSITSLNKWLTYFCGLFLRQTGFGVRFRWLNSHALSWVVLNILNSLLLPVLCASRHARFPAHRNVQRLAWEVMVKYFWHRGVGLSSTLTLSFVLLQYLHALTFLVNWNWFHLELFEKVVCQLQFLIDLWVLVLDKLLLIQKWAVH